MTHPKLTPGHDFTCLDAAVGVWMASGWEVREDQSDPPLEVDVAPEPAAPVESVQISGVDTATGTSEPTAQPVQPVPDPVPAPAPADPSSIDLAPKES